MKKFLLLLLTSMSFTTFAQIQVKEGSFHKIQGYVMLDNKDHIDVNNAPMALIKISTENITAEQRRKFIFKGNAVTYFDVKFEPGEIYLYISAAAATFIEIIHDDYGKVEYWLPETLCDYCGYEMVVQHTPYTLTPELNKPKNNFVTINVAQSEATIYIDDEYIGNGSVYKSLLIGKKHTYKIECDMYHDEIGTINVVEGDPIELNVNLRPAYGFLNVESLPEQDAMVYIDGKKVGKTPYMSDKMSSGTYNVKVLKSMFNPAEQTCVVSDGQTTNLKLDMSANYVNVTINTDAQSDIYVDDEYKGKGSWTGRISDGVHFVEARKDKHKNVSRNITLILGKDEVITLESPTPINGFFEITSIPNKADIYIDGKHYGQTPRVIYDLLIGSHELRLEKQGCAPLTKTINIEEGETLALNGTLQTATLVSISTDAEGDKIYVDDEYIGNSPVRLNLAYGTHLIKAERYGQTITKTINVAQNDGHNEVRLVFGKNVTIKSDKNGDAVYIDDKRVGITPHKVYLTYGTHTVKVTRGNQFVTKDIEVSDLGDNTFILEIGQTVQITSTKSGDKVIVDGKNVGKTPLQLNLSLGQHSVLVKRGKKTDTESIFLKGEPNQKYNFYPSRDYPFWSAVGGAFGDVGYFIGESFEDMGYFFGNMFESGYFSVSAGLKSIDNLNDTINSANSNDSSDTYYSLGLDVGGFFIDEIGVFASTSIWKYSWSVLGGLNLDISWLFDDYPEDAQALIRVGAGYTFSRSESAYIQGVEWLVGAAVSADNGIFFSFDCLSTSLFKANKENKTDSAIADSFELRFGLGWRW